LADARQARVRRFVQHSERHSYEQLAGDGSSSKELAAIAASFERTTHPKWKELMPFKDSIGNCESAGHPSNHRDNPSQQIHQRVA